MKLDFEKAVAEHKDMVYRLAYTGSGSFSDAEDIFQDVFMKLHSRTEDFESAEHLKAWLIRVTVNSVKTMKRSAWFSRRDDTPVQTIADSGNDKDAVIAVREAVMKLDKKYRIIVILYYYYGYTCNEIAEMTDIKAATVKTRLSRARDILKKQLKEAWYDE